MTLPSGPAGLTPLSAPVKARRKRQNRVIVAVVVMVLVPVLAIGGAYRYATAEVRAWAAHQAISFNTPTSVHLDSPGDYVIWTTLATADCTVSFGQQAVAVAPPVAGSPMEEAGFFDSGSFTASASGEYTVTCSSSQTDGYAMVSTASPLGRMTVVLLLGFAIGLAGFITGLVLLITGLIRNADDKRRLAMPPGGQPTSPTVPGWPPRG